MRPIALIFTFVLLMSSAAAPTVAHDGENHEGNKEEQGWPGSARAQEVARALLADSQPTADLVAQSATTCTNGFAGDYPCSNVDLLSFLPLADIGGGKGNDIWGWTDPTTGSEYAIMGRTTGTAFVDVSTPTQPIYLGNLPTTRFSSTWRDIKVHKNHAFIVSESRNHGMQVFNLTRLRGLTAPVTFSADALYSGFATAHNIAINEDSGFAYAIGTNTCSGGLHIVDINDPTSPAQAGCFSADGYTHDVQCVNYAGPDTSRTGRELCFASNEDTLTIVDVSDKSAPIQLARKTYEGASYTHQGWLTDDQRYFLIDDEADEGKGFNTRTYVFDVANPADPKHIGTHVGTNPAIDHNQYIVGNHAYQANYRSGLRILDISDIANGNLAEVGFFDVYPADDSPNFNGAWSVYPFFASGNVVVSGIEQGLYVLKPNLGPTDAPPSVNITEPADGSAVSGANVTVTATASDDDAVTQVEFFVDGASIGLGTEGSEEWTISWDTTLANNGSRTLAATATDTGGQTASHSIVVSVNNPNLVPTAMFTYECSNLSCSFNGSGSTDSDGSIVTYAWAFGDGATGSGVVVDHAYSVGGSYGVTLTVTDNDGGAASHSEELKIDGPTGTMHVGDLDGTKQLKGKSGRWEVFVTVTVHDGAHRALGGVTVSGTFSGAASASASGTTAADGTVTLATGTLAGGESVTFTVNGLAGTLADDSTANHDPDGDSDGTTITITKT